MNISGSYNRAPEDDEQVVSGLVHSVESCGTVDGPGIRFILFLSGCSLRCHYCHNPDTSFVRRGKKRTATDVLEEISRYRDFLIAADGGITISGGDPLFQAAFTKAILRGCKAMGLHTCLDTSGHLGINANDEMLADTDLILLDIKHWNLEKYKILTKADLKPTLDFAEKLAKKGIPVWLRYVLVTGLTDDIDDIRALAHYAAGLGNIERVDVLPFHQMGRFKWDELGVEYTMKAMETPDEAITAQVRAIFEEEGFAGKVR